MSVNLNDIHDVITPSALMCKVTDGYPLMTIWHDGSPTETGTAVTAATVAHATATITVTINGGVEARLGSSGAMDTNAGSYNTYKKLYDHINMVQGWHCRLEGQLHGATSDQEFNELSEIRCLGYQNAQTLTATTATRDVHGLVISNRHTCQSGAIPGGEKIKRIENEHKATNKLYYLWLTATDAGVGLIRVYSILGVEKQTLLFEQASAASNAQTEFNFSTRPIVAKPGEHLLVQYVAGGALTAVAECLVNGKSVIYR